MIYSKLSNANQDQTPSGVYMNLENIVNHNDKVYHPGLDRFMMDNSPSVYSAYEDLPRFYQDTTNFTELFRSLQQQAQEDLDWKLQFDAVENLRILNKFYAKELGDNINQFSLFIFKAIDNLRSNLSKNALLLVKEVYENFRHVAPNDDFVELTLPKILEKGISDKSFIKLEARNALKALENGGCYNSVIRVLCEKSFDKNVIVSELSFQTLVGSIKEAKENLGSRLNHNIIELLFQTLVGAINGKRAANRRLAEDLCQQLRKDFPVNEDELESYLKQQLNLKEGAKVIARAMQTKKEKASKVSDFSAFVREQKMKKEFLEEKDKTPKEANNDINRIDEI
jgi:hypothetical protein